MSELSYTIQRTERRKTATLQIVDGKLTVVVPSRFSDKQVSDLVDSRLERIQRTIASQEKILSRTETEFVSGHGFKYLGRTYRLKVYRTGTGQTGLRNGRLEVWTSKNAKGTGDEVKQSLIEWYQRRAEEKFQERIGIYEKKIGTFVSFVGLKDMKTKWGSCTSKGKITLNWRLILAPTKIVDYVVVHELCHLVCHDHSRKFWSKVMRVIPDYGQRRLWLKQHGHTLTL
jgi:predicted metal-dependent hydrolase